jgi:uncharacterized protein YecE (DUF72 family)
MLYIGCPVWAHKSWVGNFFPKGTKSSDFLREYARRLTTVEGNTTFYAAPSPATVQRWKEHTPAGFRFCLKLPRTISHSGPLVSHIDEAREFVELMRDLGSRFGPSFLQLPPRYAPASIADLRAFLDAWPKDLKLAVEVRHLDWFKSPGFEACNELLREYDCARVWMDTRPIRDLSGDEIELSETYKEARERLNLLERARERKPDVPLIPERTASFVFVRYIGHPQMEVNAPFLDEWADRLAGWIDEEVDAYVFCHCPDDTHAPLICRELHRRIAARKPVAPLPWDEMDRGAQGRLL